MERTIIHPTNVHGEPGPYSHAFSVDVSSFSRLVFIAGQLGIDRHGNVVGGPQNFPIQFLQVYDNLRNVVEAAGGTMSNIVSLRTFLASSEYLPTFQELRKEYYPQIFPPGVYPPNTLVIVNGLYRPDLVLEVEAVAAI